MRKTIVLLGCTALAACGGGEGAGPTSPGGVAIGTGTVSTGSSSSSDMPTLATPGKATTYVGVGGDQVYQYSTYAKDGDPATEGLQPVTDSGDQQKQIYAGGTSTVRNSAISIAYDPSDATFTLKVTDTNSGAGTDTRFQDPANRTDFDGFKAPQIGTPNIAAGNIRYLQSGDGDPLSPMTGSGSGVTQYIDGQPQPVGLPGSSLQRTTFFYQLPGVVNAAGTTTNYVTFAGYMRNAYSYSTQQMADGTIDLQTASVLERGAFAYGNLTAKDDVPTSGSGTYEGGMVATAVLNPTLDDATALPSYFQWIEGTSKMTVNFASGAVGFTAQGTVYDPQLDNFTTPRDSAIKQGASFSATGSATIALTSTGGFNGSMSSATITNPGASTPTLSISSTGNTILAGSTLNGAFYGPGGAPDKVEVGGGFRVVGGNPDQRIDIIGSFAGARTGN